LFRTIQK